jgi:energy-coupling factor transporter transmembrane protein EcfT
MLKRIYDGFLYKPDKLQIHPIIGIIIILVQFGFMLVSINWVLALLFLFVIIENFVFRNIKGSLSILWALLPVLIILGGLTLFFGGWLLMYQVLIRFLIGGLGFSFFFSIVNPSDLTRSFEKMKIPTRIALIPSLALMMIPRIAKDAEDTFTTLRVRGEIKGVFLRWMPRVLAIYIASVIYRSDFLAQSLYFKGLGIRRRTHYRKVKLTTNDLLRAIVWIVFIAIFTTIYCLNLYGIMLLPDFFI